MNREAAKIFNKILNSTEEKKPLTDEGSAWTKRLFDDKVPLNVFTPKKRTEAIEEQLSTLSITNPVRTFNPYWEPSRENPNLNRFFDDLESTDDDTNKVTLLKTV